MIKGEYILNFLLNFKHIEKKFDNHFVNSDMEIIIMDNNCRLILYERIYETDNLFDLLNEYLPMDKKLEYNLDTFASVKNGRLHFPFCRG